MSLEFRATQSEELADVKRFLARVFGSSERSPFIGDVNLRWKYYQPREDFAGLRSFVYSDAGRIVAHACAWPLRFLLYGEKIAGVHPDRLGRD